MLSAYPRGVDRVCPLLGLIGDRRSAVDGIDTAHRCHAEPTPLAIERGWQAKFCLTVGHPQCERYQQAMAHRGSAVLGRAAIADGLVSTRMLLAPEPPWRGMAGRARRGGAGPVVALGALAAFVSVGAVAAAAAGEGRLDFVGAALATPSPSPSATPTVTASPTASPTPTVTPSPSATPTPTPPPATVEPTPVPAPTPRSYVVQEGDTLAAIAQQFGTTVEAIQAANGIEDPDTIAVGDVLVIP